jgi:hypothetical protein
MNCESFLKSLPWLCHISCPTKDELIQSGLEFRKILNKASFAFFLNNEPIILAGLHDLSNFEMLISVSNTLESTQSYPSSLYFMFDDELYLVKHPDMGNISFPNTNIGISRINTTVNVNMNVSTRSYVTTGERIERTTDIGSGVGTGKDFATMYMDWPAGVRLRISVPSILDDNHNRNHNHNSIFGAEILHKAVKDMSKYLTKRVMLNHPAIQCRPGDTSSSYHIHAMMNSSISSDPDSTSSSEPLNYTDKGNSSHNLKSVSLKEKRYSWSQSFRLLEEHLRPSFTPQTVFNALVHPQPPRPQTITETKSKLKAHGHDQQNKTNENDHSYHRLAHMYTSTQDRKRCDEIVALMTEGTLTCHEMSSLQMSFDKQGIRHDRRISEILESLYGTENHLKPMSDENRLKMLSELEEIFMGTSGVNMLCKEKAMLTAMPIVNIFGAADKYDT